MHAFQFFNVLCAILLSVIFDGPSSLDYFGSTVVNCLYSLGKMIMLVSSLKKYI